MNGSVITPMNCVIALKVLCWLAVAVSPDNCVSAVPSGAPVNPNRFTKAGGSVPPLLKKPLMVLATFS